MNLTHVRMTTEHLDMWESLIGSRKSPLNQASIIGLGTLLALFTRRLTLEDAIKRVCDRIGIKGRAIVWQHAEPCMDVDKPHQLELLREDLAKQQRKMEAKAKAAARRSGEAKSAKTVKKKSTTAKKTTTKSTKVKLKTSSKAELSK